MTEERAHRKERERGSFSNIVYNIYNIRADPYLGKSLRRSRPIGNLCSPGSNPQTDSTSSVFSNITFLFNLSEIR
jgi:hypothetical protein